MIADVALPAIAADLKVSAADVVWVINVYQFAIVASLLPLGALGDIVGHERIYLGGVLLFTLACACAWSLPSFSWRARFRDCARARPWPSTRPSSGSSTQAECWVAASATTRW